MADRSLPDHALGAHHSVLLTRSVSGASRAARIRHKKGPMLPRLNPPCEEEMRAEQGECGCDTTHMQTLR